MRFIFLLGFALTLVVHAKPGNHAIFPTNSNDIKPGGRIINPNALPEDEATRIKKYHREWMAYNRFINLYLKDHPRFKILKKVPEQVITDLTNPDPVKTFTANINASVENAVKEFIKRNPEATASDIEVYRQKAFEGYRRQVSGLYQQSVDGIARAIKFKELHGIKKEFDKTKEGGEEFGAIVAERKAFSYEGLMKLTDQVITEDSPIKEGTDELLPIFPKVPPEEVPSMQEMWEMIQEASRAQERGLAR